jgi:trehalose synthase-fused probable maltokinase
MAPRAAAAFDASWLAARRWFRAKARPLAEVRLADAARLGGDHWLLVLEARYRDGGADRYLVPAVAGPDGGLREPADGDGTWRAAVEAIAGELVVDGDATRFRFRSTPALASALDGEDPGQERRLGVEQSNTSVRLGDRLILKVYRLLERGLNPEVEVSAFLTAAGFGHAPSLLGWAEADLGDEVATAFMLQELVPSRGDGWAWLLAALSAPPQGPLEALAGVAHIGGITAELHAALAARPDDPAFPARPAEDAERIAWRASAERELDAALAALAGEQRARLTAVHERVRGRFAAIEADAGGTVQRIHGDYHLGQLLRTEDGFAVIDFEGEPARPLAERRRPASPLRDVAGMLRSLDYAARTAERDGPDGFAPEAWLADARATFLAAYGGEAIGHPDLLAALEAEKACYEVRYEANNRPDWTWLPLAALERLAA